VDAVEHGVEIDADRPVPVGIVRAAQALEQADPGIVAQDVDRAELRLAASAAACHAARSSLFGSDTHRGPVGHVEDDAVQAVGRTELGPRQLEVLGQQIGDRHLHPARLERARHAEPDAAAAAGDERGLAGELTHRSISPRGGA
jgi:hypothetical protein